MQDQFDNYIKPKEKHSYTDLDLTFTIHPVKKDLVISTDSNAIRKSLKNLVLTNHYERLFHPEIGSNVSKLLFEPMNPVTANYLEEEIFNTITNFEPRVKLSNIDVIPYEEYNAYNIVITYYEANATTPTVTELLLERLR